MCDDHPVSSSAVPKQLSRRSILRGLFAAPIVTPAILAASAPNAAAADTGIRSTACSAAGSAPIATATGPAAALKAFGVNVHPRSDWAGKLVAKGPLQAETPRFLLVHHSASSNAYTADAVPGVIRGFFGFHTGPDKGWNDVAYNFFVDRFGGVWEARTGSLAGPVRGDATGGNQGFSQLVCMIGDFNAAPPTDAAMASLTRVLAALAQTYGIATDPGSTASFVSRQSNRWKAGQCVETPTISGHREMSFTGCPGDALFSVVRSDLARRVSDVRAKR